MGAPSYSTTRGPTRQWRRKAPHTYPPTTYESKDIYRGHTQKVLSNQVLQQYSVLPISRQLLFDIARGLFMPEALFLDCH